MRVTAEVVREATFGAELEEVVELNLSNKNIDDLGEVMCKLASLRELNVAVRRARLGTLTAC